MLIRGLTLRTPAFAFRQVKRSYAERYTQGQSPNPGVREYFYFIDHHGQLFLDDARIKNFTSCFKDKVFLEFFFARLRPNTTGRYDEEFPYLSLCGRERNFVRCDDRPIVFLDLVQRAEISHWLLTFGFAQSSKLSVPFQPQHLYMNPNSGRIYHPTINFDDPEKNTVHESLVVGLMCSDLALRLADMFEWTQLNHADTGAPPDHFLWEQTVYKLSNALSPYIAST
ncbi:upf0598 protein C8orf82 [Clonorchis sinensis]|uniref:Upf0598 protein C8orf82 n=1 Tax=Clonorchis sinensis TaxID=79923 RepID=A0A8T1M1Q0_CLOSI|nr:upf0598 protein C8orf82 [Clonorchis sinensis]